MSHKPFKHCLNLQCKGHGCMTLEIFFNLTQNSSLLRDYNTHRDVNEAGKALTKSKIGTNKEIVNKTQLAKSLKWMVSTI